MKARNWMRGILAAAVLAGAVSAADAAVIYSVTNTSSTNTWSTASIWDNNQAPSAGNDYVATHVLRTASTFAGDSLTVNTNGVVALKLVTTTANSLHMAGGSIQNYHADNNTAVLAGTLYIDAPTSISISNANNRGIAIAQPCTATRPSPPTATTPTRPPRSPSPARTTPSLANGW